MRKPSRLLVAAIALPFLAGCTGVLAQPLPQPPSRADTQIRGVILDRSGTEERIEYESTEVVEWTESSVTITGALTGDNGNITTRTFQLREVESVLVHQVDVDRGGKDLLREFHGAHFFTLHIQDIYFHLHSLQ